MDILEATASRDGKFYYVGRVATDLPPDEAA